MQRVPPETPDATAAMAAGHPVEDTVDLARLRNQVMDTLLFTLCLIGLPALVMAQLRSLELGWGLREAVHLGVYTSLLAMAWQRNRIGPRIKANCLVLLALSIGVAGTLKLGVFAGGIFFLPIPLFIAAQFHRLRLTLLVGLLVLCVLLVSALGYAAWQWQLPATAEFLLRSPLNWGAYITSFCIMVVFIAASILRYRREVELLLLEASVQRDTLLARNRQLEQALADVHTLRGVIPICSWCHKIRDDAGAWEQMEQYISAHSDAQFSHGICPECLSKASKEV